MENENTQKAKDSELLRNAFLRIKSLTAKIESYSEPIAIIGMSCRFPGGANSPSAFWDLISRGGDGISKVPADRWDIDSYYDPDPEAPGKMNTQFGGFLDQDVSSFDASFFGISPREAEYMDPQQRLLLEVSYEAIESAGIAPANLEGSSTGVFIGICTHDYMDLITASGNKTLINPYVATGNVASTATGRISFTFDFQGPNFAIDTACSSSLVAIDQACESLHNGQADLAIAGGVNLILSPDVSIDFAKAGMLAPDGHCKTFDARANGYVRGEGCGIIILKRLSDAKKDGDNILAVIKASGINQDGTSSGLTVPNGKAQEALIHNVLTKAKLAGADIDYVEAHGTGTPLGDPIEVGAIAVTYGIREKTFPLKLGSVKTNIGHLEGAAGIAGVIKIILALQHETLPPHLHFKKLNPHIELNFPAEIVTSSQPWKRGERIRRAAVSSFGFSGTNAHIILEEAPQVESKITDIEERPFHILTLSAKTEHALDELLENYQAFLAKTDYRLSDICYTANTGRNHEKYRLAIIAKDLDELKLKIKKGEFVKGEALKTKPYEVIYKGHWEQELNELTLAYTQGAIIDWKNFDKSYERQKVQIPSYPFQRKRYWAPAIDKANKTLEKNQFDNWFYQVKWKEHPIFEKRKDESKGKNYLVFGTQNKFEKIFEPKCIFVKLDESFSGEHKIETNITDVLYCSDFDKDCKQLLQVVQAIVKSGLTPRLWILASNGQIVTGNETPIDLSQAPLFGFGKVVALEHPELRCVRIDFDDSMDPQILLDEMERDDNEDEIAIREGKRYVPRINQYIPQVNKDVIISSEHSYLITGGLGALGLACAEWLIEKGAKNLILTSRTKPKEEVQKRIDQNRQHGVQITIVKSDISKKTDVDMLFEDISENHFPLKGIFHAAGITDNNYIINENWERFAQVLAPKVAGTVNICEALKSNEINLDFILLFSSISGLLGSVTLSAYAAANYYLDQYAQYAHQKGLPITSIAWGPWSEIGMAAAEEERELRLGYQLISPKDGLKAIEIALKDGRPSSIIAPMNWAQYLNKLQFVGGIFSDIEKDQENSLELSKDELGFALEKANPKDQHKIAIEYISQIVKQVLGLRADEQVDTSKGFFDMGMDSLLATELRNKLQRALGNRCIIKSTISFDYPNINDLTDHILIQLGLGEMTQEEGKSTLIELKREEITKAVSEMGMNDILEKLKRRHDGKR